MAQHTETPSRRTLPESLARVHMVGIGGAGMSGLARILLARGGQVSGSDAKDGRGILALRTRGAQIAIGHNPAALDQLPGGPTVVVTTHAAIPKTNPELVAARERGIPILLRPAVLATLMEGYSTLLVAGTHGKTSTTSMAVVALQNCGLDPSFAVGGELNESGTNAHHGTGGIFVAEADESDGSLLEYRPDVIVVTNIEADHLDFFGSEQAYVDVFDQFCDRVASGGTVVVCADDPGSAALAQRMSSALAERDVAVLTYGRNGTAAQLLSWEPTSDGGRVRVRFDLSEITGASEATGNVTGASEATGNVTGASEATGNVTGASEATGNITERTFIVTVPGEHMALNALGAILGCVRAGGELDAVIAGIEAFSGVHRRFEFRGTARGVRLFDDYAHHPTEVAAVLAAARSVAGEGRVIAVFQPHLYSRTREFATEFARALSAADQVVVADVYGAREEPLPGVSGRSISELVTVPAVFAPSLSNLPRVVAGLVTGKDIVLTLGAGDITMQGPEILAAIGAASTTPGE
ncbi:UDP-N-acetylmuramate--L-alanine ligase [Gordonia effusa NBRC 100432]|uniref:UDP-N-acetylmuramate--L-alanine ligase n=1 Tax=Gordonia effusa NBRC 100432 TaxID=1077974 RepID=H0R2N2_9ACTN|nr:UDP-N-acetylmuramate--L-alanine ligase [Gordonia effusa]GAB19333.1 UDP-N-acetylmuramate--L-alanine ligase [Gordonia effusa NBRC 100432]